MQSPPLPGLQDQASVTVEASRSTPLAAYAGVAAVIALAIVSYSRFLGTGFVASDSLALIESSRISRFGDIIALFGHPVMSNTSFSQGELVYRPFASLTFGADFLVWGLNAVGYHLSNLGLHVVGIFIVWRLLVMLGLRGWSSAFGAAVFALHPLGVATLPPIARRDSILPVVAFLGAWVLVLAAQRSTGSQRTGTSIASYLLTIIALLSKESSFAAIGLLPFLVVAGARANGSSWRQALQQSKMTAPHLIIAAVVFGVRVSVIGGLGGAGDPSQSIASDWQILAAYTRDLVWSFGALAPSTHPVWLVVGGLLLLGCAAAARALPRRHCWLVVMALMWMTTIGVFAVLFHVATVGWLVYFALPGLAILLAAGVEGAAEGLWHRYAPWPRRLARIWLLVVLSGLAVVWLVTSPLIKSYRQWQIAGDASTRYLDALTACVAGAPDVPHVRLEEMPSLLDDGTAETNQMGVTMFEDYTIQSALRLLFPDRKLTFTVWSRHVLRGDDRNIGFACTAESQRVILSASYS